MVTAPQPRSLGPGGVRGREAAVAGPCPRGEPRGAAVRLSARAGCPDGQRASGEAAPGREAAPGERRGVPVPFRGSEVRSALRAVRRGCAVEKACGF